MSNIFVRSSSMNSIFTDARIGYDLSAPGIPKNCLKTKECEWSVPQAGSEIPLSLVEAAREDWNMIPFTTDIRDLMSRTPRQPWNECSKAGTIKCVPQPVFGNQNNKRCFCRCEISPEYLYGCRSIGSQHKCCEGCIKCDILYGKDDVHLLDEYIPAGRGLRRSPPIERLRKGDYIDFHQPKISNTKAIVHKNINKIQPNFEYETISGSPGLTGTVYVSIQIRLSAHALNWFLRNLDERKERWNFKIGDAAHNRKVIRHRSNINGRYPVYGESLLKTNLFGSARYIYDTEKWNEPDYMSLSILEDAKKNGGEATREATGRIGGRSTELTEHISIQNHPSIGTIANWYLVGHVTIDEKEPVFCFLKHPGLARIGISLKGEFKRISS